MSYNELLLNASVQRCAHLVVITRAATLECHELVGRNQTMPNEVELEVFIRSIVEVFQLDDHEQETVITEVINRLRDFDGATRAQGVYDDVR